MNKYLQQLVNMGEAPSRTIIGLMSGTSLDGLDIALCKFEGAGLATKIKLQHFKTANYEAEFKDELKTISSKRTVDLQKVTLLNAYIGNYYATLILSALSEWGVNPAQVDLIASHGQTIFHAPFSIHQDKKYPNATLQIGDADHIAVKTGIITISDFRQKNLAAGGEGAPLAAYGDYLIFGDEKENRILLNIGGIANFTFLPAGFSTEKMFSTDTGPGNTLMDQYVHKHFNHLFFDKDAAIARKGTVHPSLLKALLEHPFFKLNFPKTTGPELFDLDYVKNAQKQSNSLTISHEDVMATLSEFTAQTIIQAIEQSIAPKNLEIYLSGGGMHNPLLREKLTQHFNKSLKDTSHLHIHPDAKEAVLFALLANECVMGSTQNYGQNLHMPAVTMGKISLPG